MAAANPFDGNNVLGTPYGNQGVAGFPTNNKSNKSAEVVNLNNKLQAAQRYINTKICGHTKYGCISKCYS